MFFFVSKLMPVSKRVKACQGKHRTPSGRVKACQTVSSTNPPNRLESESAFWLTVWVIVSIFDPWSLVGIILVIFGAWIHRFLTIFHVSLISLYISYYLYPILTHKTLFLVRSKEMAKGGKGRGKAALKGFLDI